MIKKFIELLEHHPVYLSCLNGIVSGVVSGIIWCNIAFHVKTTIAT